MISSRIGLLQPPLLTLWILCQFSLLSWPFCLMLDGSESDPISIRQIFMASLLKTMAESNISINPKTGRVQRLFKVYENWLNRGAFFSAKIPMRIRKVIMIQNVYTYAYICIYDYIYICIINLQEIQSLSSFTFHLHLLLRIIQISTSISSPCSSNFSQELETFLESFDKIFVIASGTGSSRAIDAWPPTEGSLVAKEMLSRDMLGDVLGW